MGPCRVYPAWMSERVVNVLDGRLWLRWLFTLSLLLVVVSVPAQTPASPAEHAAAIVAHLHDTMLDPTSFVLDGVYVTKPNRMGDKEHKGQSTYCYAFRSHNTMGGYAEGRAYEDPLDHGNLVLVQPSMDGAFMGYDTGWVAPCKAKNIDRDITADVAAIAPALYKKSR